MRTYKSEMVLPEVKMRQFESGLLEPKVFVVLVNLNRCHDTVECIDSLLQNPFRNKQIVVVDQGSVDGSVRVLAERFPSIEIIDIGENLGYAKSANVGISYALDGEADYILVMNNDTVVRSDLLNVLVHTGDSDTKRGLIGGKIYYYDDPNRIWSVGGRIILLKASGIWFHEGEVDTGQFNVSRPIGLVSGCMMFVRAEVFRKVGLLAEEYFFGAEEWDFSARVSRAGYTIWYEPNAIIWHKVSVSHSHFSPKYIYGFYRCKIIFARKFLSPIQYRLWYPIFAFYARHLAAKKFKRRAEERGVEDFSLARVNRAIELALQDAKQSNTVTLEDMDRADRLTKRVASLTGAAE